MKKGKLLIIAVIAVIVIAAGIFYMPIKVLDADGIDNYSPYIMVYYIEEGVSRSDKDYVVSDDAVEKEVLEYLSTCKMRRTLFRKNNFRYIEFFVDISDYANSENVINFTIQKDGGNELRDSHIFRYRFLNSKEVIKNLEEIITAQADNDNNVSVTADPSPDILNTPEPEPDILSTPEPEFFMAEEPLPEYNGDGRLFKSSEYSCKQFSDLFGHEPDLFTAAPDNIETLPVFKENYISGVTAVTEEMKNGFRTQAEEFLNSAGRSDLIEEGLNPDEEFLADKLNPSFNCEFSDVSVNVLPFAVTVMTDIPGLNECDEASIKDMLKSNNWLSAACELAGIDDPVVISRDQYNYHGDKSGKTIYVHQNSSDTIEAFKNKAFASMFISVRYDSDPVVIGAKRNNIAKYIGDYKLVPYDDALNTLQQERGVNAGDVLGYEIEYSRDIIKGYYIPYYKFWFEITEGNLPEQDTGLHMYCEYNICAVED